jgi:F-type H+-transporting ATPase subunit epsilon
MAHLMLDVVTPAKAVIHREVDEVIVPGVLGEFGILPMHSPFLTMIGTGTLRTIRDKEVRKYVVSGGFAEVSGDRVIILTEICESADEIDLANAKKTVQETEKRVLELDASNESYAEHWNRLKRAQARVEVAESRDF